jgi:hypothetical protein
MSWKNPLRNRAKPWHKFNVKDAVDYFRDEELEPVHVSGPCPHCHAPCALIFLRMSPDERIELRIGAYRIGECTGCGAFCVVYARVSSKKKKEQETTARLKKAGLLPKKSKNMPTADYIAMVDGWYKQNGWTS